MNLRLLLAFSTLVVTGSAATSTTWEVTGFSDFLKGRLFGLSLTVDGTLSPGPSIQFNTSMNQPALWALTPAPDGSVYAATGHQGKVYRITPDGKAAPFWNASQPEIFALCVDKKGRLYAGTSPNGAVYQIENGKANLLWKSPVKYIWSIQASADGSLFVATGEKGQIFRIQPDGAAEVYYETGQVNATVLALGTEGHLYAGTEPNGLLFDILKAGQGTVLYDSTLPEIRAIAVAPDGNIYAAAMGGAVASRSGGAQTTSTATPTMVTSSSPTVITVTESASNLQQSSVTTPPAAQTGSSVAASGTAASTSGVVEVSGVEKSAIYKITPQHVVQTLRSSKEDNVYDLQLDGNALVFSTDVRGRVYRLADGRTTLLAEIADGETTRIVKAGPVWFGGMSNPGRVFALGTAGASAASYESLVHDSTSVARWGHLQWHGSGSGVVFRTRTGYSARPDATWSAWSKPITSSGMALIDSPPARFIQWKAEWAAGAASQITAVDVPYLPQNTPPSVHSISVTSIVGTNAAKSGATAAAQTSPYSVTVTDTGEAPAASSATAASQTVSRLQSTQTQISWQADDPDSDKLAYSIYFRAEDEKEWQLIRSKIPENTIQLDPDVLADGRYFFRVVASDAPANSPDFAREAELVSTAVLVDNTPPAVAITAPHRNGAVLDIDVEGVDQTSPLRLCEYSLDAGSWQPIESVDGVTDSPREQFHLHLEKLRPGEHLLVFRIYDAANNAGLGRVVLR